ncbi:tetratricopeptide repeat protein [Catenovulum adriaticum]|uniref:Sel1 repeat family protein n=1 Tax=Catenovulum adriaticum TaxID=2984846 RepID=A0ABY7AK44_9ALTE|nr:tetratricopeptide repeat protein [Catenovulum sp. TS8]WAJ69899.1 sel1 repeat family protein [Catenovulum sp. TS8]
MYLIRLICLTLSLLIMLAGCATRSEHKWPIQPNVDYFSLADHGYQQWLKQRSNLVLLAQAKRDFESALQLQPEQINAQYYHYRASASLSMALDKINEDELLSYFNEMNLSLYPETVSPAYVTYAIKYNQAKQANQLQQRFSELKTIIQRAIKQNPYNTQNWIILSELYQQQDQVDLSIAAATQAYKMQPDEIESVKAMALGINIKAESTSCVYEQTDLLQTSLVYFNKALQLSQQASDYLEYSAFQLLRLGDIKQAQLNALKAFKRSASYTNSLLTFETSLLLGDYETAAQALIPMSKEFAPEQARKYQLLLSIAQQDVELTGHYLGQFLNQESHEQLDIYTALLVDHVQKQRPKNEFLSRPFIESSNTLSEFYQASSSDLQANAKLLESASDTCSLANAHYFIGFKAFSESNYKQAYKHFNQVVGYKNYRQPSYLWAHAMLQTAEMGHYANYLSTMQEQIKQADANAQFELGVEYFLAKLVPYDLPKALSLLESSAAQKNEKALNLLAYLYSDSEKIERNIVKAIDYYQQSAEQGNAYALYQLGLIYQDGIAVNKDEQLAVEYYLASIKQGGTAALLNLANLYLQGQGVAQSNEKAWHYLKQSALSGDYEGQIQLALFYQKQNEELVKSAAWFSIAKEQLEPGSKVANKLAQFIQTLAVPDELVQQEIEQIQPQIKHN